MKNLFQHLLSSFRLILTFGLSIFAWFGPPTVRAQSINSLINDVVMPSPEVASQGNVGDIPVGYSSGIPQISIPIYTLVEGPLSRPISLSYSASGIRVAELASWVGLGWNLNASSMISRTVMGKADESSGGYFSTGGQLDATNANDELAVKNGLMDGEPDIFNYSIGSEAGKFLFMNGDLANPIAIPETDVKIEMTLSSSGSVIESFRLTDIDGTVYFFGKHPITQVEAIDKQEFIAAAGLGVANKQSSAWHLTRIESLDGFSAIDFEYEDDVYAYTYPISRYANSTMANGGELATTREIEWTTLKIKYRERVFDFNTGTFTVIESESPITFPDLTDPIISVTPQIPNNSQLIRYLAKSLKLAKSSTVTVNFISNQDREDLITPGLNEPQARSLEAIEIIPNNSSVCTRYELDHDYFEDNSVEQSTLASVNLRLRLNSIQQKSCDGSIVKSPHVFHYHNDPAQVGPTDRAYLPNTHSKAIDHWGYYNAQEQNNHIPFNIPRDVKEGVGSQSPVWISDVFQAKRETNEFAMMLGVLEKIDYPLGGINEFMLEANDVWDTWEEYEALTSTNFSCGAGNNSQYTTPFQLSASTNFDLYEYELTFSMCPGTTPPIAFELVLFERPIGGAFTQVMTAGSPQVTTTNPLPLSTLFPGFTPDQSKEYQIGLLNTSVNAPAGVSGPAGYYEATLTINGLISYTGNRKVGGLRVKQITTKDGNNTNPSITKTFEYRRGDIPARSSGTLIKEPTYGQLFSTVTYSNGLTQPTILSNGCRLEAPIGSSIAGAILYENSIVPLGSFEGYHISYEWVQERVGAGNGYTVYEMETEDPATATGEIQAPFIFSVNEFPIPPAQARILQGMVKNQWIWEEANHIVGSTITTPVDDAYEYHGIDPNGNGCEGSGEPVFQVLKMMSTPVLIGSVYSIRSRKPYRVSKTEVMQDGQTTINEMTYDTKGDHLQVNSQRTTNGNGDIYETRFKYVPDYEINTPMGTGSNGLNINNLTFLNVILPPIETQTWLDVGASANPEMIGGELTTYKNYGTGGDMVIQPFKSFVFESSDPVSEASLGQLSNTNGEYTEIIPNTAFYVEQTEVSFDASGESLVEVQPANDISTSYLWGYNETVPVAQVSNASPNEIGYASFEGEGEHKWVLVGNISMNNQEAKTGGKSLDLTNGGELQSDVVPDGTYTISFWTKGSASTSFSGNGFLTEKTELSKTTDDGWTYREFQMGVSGYGIIVISGSVQVDEARIYPIDAQMTTYCYDEAFRYHTITDVNNRSIFYAYDALSRLIEVRDLDQNIISRTRYNCK